MTELLCAPLAANMDPSVVDDDDIMKQLNALTIHMLYAHIKYTLLCESGKRQQEINKNIGNILNELIFLQPTNMNKDDWMQLMNKEDQIMIGHVRDVHAQLDAQYAFSI